MRMDGSAYFYLGIMILMVSIIAWSLRMEYFESKLLPIIVAGGVFVMSGAGMWHESQKARQAAPVAKQEKLASRRGYALAIAWVAAFFLGILFLGYIIAIALFVLAYMKSHGSRWPVAIGLAIITPAFMYIVFELALKIELFRGLFFGG